MANDEEEFDFLAANKAEIDKVRVQQEQNNELQVYLEQKHPLYYFIDLEGRRQYNPESNRYRREGIPAAKREMGRRRALKYIASNPKLKAAHDKIQQNMRRGGPDALLAFKKEDLRRGLPQAEKDGVTVPPGKIYVQCGTRPNMRYNPATGRTDTYSTPKYCLINDPAAAKNKKDQPEKEDANKNAGGGRKGGRGRRKPRPPLGIDFDEQAFLWDHFDEFKNILRSKSGKKAAQQDLGKVPYEVPNYKNFIQLTADDPAVTCNKLWGHGIDSLNDLTTAQLSHLIPYMRLYKQVEGEDGEAVNITYPFNKFTTMQSILDSRENRGTDAGLVSINWEDTGGTPVTAGLAMKGEITLHFQSLESIFKERHVDGHTISFGELLRAKGQHKLDKQQQIEFNKIAANTNDERELADALNCPNVITNNLMEIGWTLPDLSNDTDVLGFGRNNLIHGLERLRRTYLLAISNHTISVTENGDIQLRIDFTAGIEGRTLSVSADLLQIDENNLDPNETGDKKIIAAKLARSKLQTRLARSNKKIEKIKKKKARGSETRMGATAAQKVANKKSIEKGVAAEIKKQKAWKDKISTQNSNIRNVAYQRLLTTIRAGVSGGKSGINYFDIDKQSIDIYKKFLENGTAAFKESQKATKERKQEIIEEMAIARADMGIGTMKSNRPEQDEGSIAMADPTISQLTGLIRLKSPTKIYAKRKKGQKKRTIESYKQAKTPAVKKGFYRIHYVFLGDIIEAAMSVLYNPRLIKKGKLAGFKKGVCPKAYTAMRVMLGPFTYPDPWTGETIKGLNALADIPISLNYFNAWWYNNVIQKGRNKYHLRTFLKDLGDKLLNNVVSPKRWGGSPGKSPMFKIDAYVFPQNHPLNKAWEGKEGEEKPRIDINELMPGGRAGKTTGSSTKFSQWLYVYSIGGDFSRSENLVGSVEEDAKIFLPHFYVGADKGIIQNIQFSKTKIPGAAEMYIAQSSNNRGDNQRSLNLAFQNLYDADIKIFGNPAFKIGMMCYINARSMGVGIGSSYQDRQESGLGIGGYYSVYKVRNEITADQFITTLTTKQLIGLRKIIEKRKEA